MKNHVLYIISIILLLTLPFTDVYVYADTVESFKITVYPDGSIQPTIILNSDTNEETKYIVGSLDKNYIKISLSSIKPLNGNYSIDMNLFITSKQQTYRLFGHFNLNYRDESGEIHITALMAGYPGNINFTKMKIRINVNGEASGKYLSLIQSLIENTTLQQMFIGLASNIEVSDLYVSDDTFHGEIMMTTNILKNVKIQEFASSIKTEEEKVRTTIYLYVVGNLESLIKSFLKLRYNNRNYIMTLSLRVPYLELDKLFSKFTPLPPTSFEVVLENNYVYVKFPRIIIEGNPKDTLSEFASWIETTYGLHDNTTVTLQPYGEVKLEKSQVSLSELKSTKLNITSPISAPITTRAISQYITNTVYTTSSNNIKSMQKNVYLYIGIGAVIATSFVIYPLMRRKR